MFAVMDSEPSPINWIDDSSKPPGSFVRHQGFALVMLDEVLPGLWVKELPRQVSFVDTPKLDTEQKDNAKS